MARITGSPTELTTITRAAAAAKLTATSTSEASFRDGIEDILDSVLSSGELVFFGSGSITVPQDANRMVVSGSGGGGGGARGSTGNARPGGGAGAVAYYAVVSVTSGETITIAQGDGGAGATSTFTAGINGTATTFTGSTTGLALSIGGGFTPGSVNGANASGIGDPPGGSISGTVLAGLTKSGNTNGTVQGAADGVVIWGEFPRGAGGDGGASGAAMAGTDGLAIVNGFFTA